MPVPTPAPEPVDRPDDEPDDSALLCADVQVLGAVELRLCLLP